MALDLHGNGMHGGIQTEHQIPPYVFQRECWQQISNVMIAPGPMLSASEEADVAGAATVWAMCCIRFIPHQCSSLDASTPS
ncbi:hypothetical protein SETIT_3G360700v2 [Setaria italica]|uniref:Uncharacterized protein n=1 Tax=Setaria italica TaxID=4555 RepID=A0A368QMV5_SETIT|nr:hypothetical protein SETIT_3G360700v2 [Setaria italica]